MCAANTHLERAVSEGRFRRELYYRINVIPIIVPALRHRPSYDILPPAYAFVREFSDAFGREVHGFSASAEQAATAPSEGRRLAGRPWNARLATCAGVAKLVDARDLSH
jgi:DNA-binding NtrC family response regulator